MQRDPPRPTKTHQDPPRPGATPAASSMPSMTSAPDGPDAGLPAGDTAARLFEAVESALQALRLQPSPQDTGSWVPRAPQKPDPMTSVWRALGDQIDLAVRQAPKSAVSAWYGWLAPRLAEVSQRIRLQQDPTRELTGWLRAAHRLLDRIPAPADDPKHLRERARWVTCYTEREQMTWSVAPGAGPLWWDAVVGTPIQPFTITWLLDTLREGGPTPYRSRGRTVYPAQRRAPTPPSPSRWGPWMLERLPSWRPAMAEVWGDGHPRKAVKYALGEILWDQGVSPDLRMTAYSSLEEHADASQRYKMLNAACASGKGLAPELRRRLLLDTDRDLRLLAMGWPVSPAERDPTSRAGSTPPRAAQTRSREARRPVGP